MVARFARIIPLLIVLAVVAVVVYMVAMFRYSPARAKEILIRVFTWITGALSAFFLLATLYALLENNGAVLELMGSFLAASAVALVVTRVCNAVFLRHHPDYRHKPMRTTKDPRFPWNILLTLLKMIGKTKR